MTAPPREAVPRPAPTVRPPASRAADRLLKAAMFPLILGVCGGMMAWLAHRPGPAIAVAALGIGAALILAAASGVFAVRSMRFNPWPGIALAAAVGGAAAWILLPLAGLAWLRVAVAAAAAAGIGKVIPAGIRYHRRHAAYHRWAQALAVVLAQGIGQIEQVLAGLARTVRQEHVTAPNFGVAPNAAWSLRVIRWSGYQIRQAILKCPAHDDISNPDFLIKIRDALTRRAGVEFLSLSVDTQRDEITITVLDGPEDDGEEQDRKTAAAGYAKEVAGDTLKGVKIKVLEWDEDDPEEPEDAGVAWPLRAFEITFDRNPKLTLPQNRDQFKYHLGMQLYNDPAMLRDKWDLPLCRVVLRKRATFPAIVPFHPVDIPALFGDLIVVVYGYDEDGNLAFIQLSDTDAPHTLITGGTGTGKSVLLRIIAIGAARQGIDVRGCDPKRVEMRGLRGWPNVTRVATRVEDMILLIEKTYAEMLQRYKYIEEDGAREEDYQRILLIIDEYLMFSMLVNDYWAELRTQLPGQQPKEHPVMRKIRGLVVMARGGVMNLVLATQRGDADIFPDGVRDSIGARVAMGRQSPQSAQMMFGDASVGRDIPPLGSRGVGTTLTADGPARIKVSWLPDPAKWDDPVKPLSADERQLLLDMLPPGAEWDGPLPYQAPDPGFEDTTPGGDIAAGKPHVRLLFFARAAMLSREAHLSDGTTGGAPASGDVAAHYGWNPGTDGQLRPSGAWIGCAAGPPDDRRVYLHPGRVLEVAERLAAQMKVPFPFKRAELDTALRTSGLLRSDTEGGEQRWTVLRQVPGNDLEGKDRRQRVWDIPEDELLGDVTTETPEGRPGPPRRPAAAPALPPAAGERRADELADGDRIVLAFEDGQVMEATVYSIEPDTTTGTDPEHDGTARLVLNYIGEDGSPGFVRARTDHPIRLAAGNGTEGAQ
jgi:hypothetical protein